MNGSKRTSMHVADAPASSGAPSWAALDARHVWHPYTQMLTAPVPIDVARAEGAYLYRSNGTAILDAISSWWVTLHGHAHPAIVAAIARQAAQLDQVIFAGFMHEPAARLAAQLATITPGDLDRVFFSDGGSTSVEVALKICIGFWANRGEPRTRFLALEGAYHGDTFGAMSVSERSAFTRGVTPLLFEVERLPFAAPGTDGSAMLDAARAALAGGAIAGVIVEPMLLGAAGMRMWDAGLLRSLATLCNSHGVPFIADEVLTGFGRTGRMFACEHADIVPDVLCLSKGLTGGHLPLGATLCRPYLYDAFLHEDRSRMLFHGHSFTANPISCAAALASLDLFESEPVSRRIAATGALHAERLADLEACGSVCNVRRCGTVAAFDLRADSQGYLSDAARGLAARALDHGFLLRPLGEVLYVLPPYSTPLDALHELYDFLLRELRD